MAAALLGSWGREVGRAGVVGTLWNARRAQLCTCRFSLVCKCLFTHQSSREAGGHLKTFLLLLLAMQLFAGGPEGLGCEKKRAVT